jgi:hypothetical protein
MPGVETCGRCGSTLRLETAVLDVHPPRATALRKGLRRLLPWRWAAAGVRNTARAAGRETRRLADEQELNLPPAGVLARVVVPGLPYFYLGNAAVGWLVVGVYVPLLLLGVLFFGTFLGSVLLGLAVSVHAGSVIGLLLRYATSVPVRVLTGLLVLASLGLCVYGPAVWAVNQYARPLTIDEASEPLKPGDVLLLNPRAYRSAPPRPGDIVLFRAGQLYVPAGTGGVRYNTMIAGGERIDRILAGPDSTVEWKDGRLLVNGVESDMRPLNPARLPAEFSVRVPEGRYLIFPSTTPRPNPNLSAELLLRTSLIPGQDIDGSIYIRTQPLSRFGRLR